MLTIGIGVRLHLAVCPDQIAVQIHIRIAIVFSCFIVKTEQLRAGRFIQGCVCINVRIVDVDDELIGTHEAVIDSQRLLTQLGGSIHSAVVKVNPNVLCCSSVNIDYFSFALKVQLSNIMVGEQYVQSAYCPSGALKVVSVNTALV